MPKLTTHEIEAFLNEREHLARIATVRADGSPSVVPVWFLYERGRIHITPRKHSEFGRNLRRDPRTSITIDEEAGAYRKVLVEGRVDFSTKTARTTAGATSTAASLADMSTRPPRTSTSPRRSISRVRSSPSSSPKPR